MWLKLVNSFSILWCQALFGLSVLHLSKVNFLVPRMYFVKLHGTHFNYVLACISDMLMYSNTGFARYHILPLTFARCIFSLLFSYLLFFFVFICVYVLYCYHELANKDLYKRNSRGILPSSGPWLHRTLRPGWWRQRRWRRSTLSIASGEHQWCRSGSMDSGSLYRW